MGRGGKCPAEPLVAANRRDFGNLLVGDIMHQADRPFDAALVAPVGIHRQADGCQRPVLAVDEHFLAAAQAGLQVLGIDCGDQVRARLRRQQLVE